MNPPAATSTESTKQLQNLSDQEKFERVCTELIGGDTWLIYYVFDRLNKIVCSYVLFTNHLFAGRKRDFSHFGDCTVYATCPTTHKPAYFRVLRKSNRFISSNRNTVPSLYFFLSLFSFFFFFLLLCFFLFFVDYNKYVKGWACIEDKAELRQRYCVVLDKIGGWWLDEFLLFPELSLTEKEKWLNTYLIHVYIFIFFCVPFNFI